MEKLTEREQQAYDFIVKYFKDNGFSPSYQEIAEGIYYGSATSVTPIIQKLKGKGYIELPYKATARAIKVVGMEHAIGQTIPLDKVKQAREEIIATNDATLAIVEVLDNLIESEGIDGNI